MTIEQLRQQIASEVGLNPKASDQLIAVIYQIIAEESRQTTATIRLDELYYPNQILTPTSSEQSAFPFPNDDALIWQHIDRKSVRWYQTDDLTLPAPTLFYRGTFMGINAGRPRYFNINGGNINIYPYMNIETTNRIVFSGYKYPLTFEQKTGDETIPDVIVPTVRQRVLARLAPYTDPKKFKLFTEQSRSSRIEMMGQVSIADTNGRK